jgi:hypothetical protein
VENLVAADDDGGDRGEAGVMLEAVVHVTGFPSRVKPRADYATP